MDTSNNLLSEEYQLAGSWSDGPNALTVSSLRDTPVSVRLQGTWTRTDAAGAALSNVSVAWSTANGNYFFHNALTDNPALTNPAGTWTDQAGATQAVTATADPFLFNNPGGTMRFGKIDGTHIDFLFTPTGGGSTVLFVENGAGVFADDAGLGLTLTPPVGFAWSGLKMPMGPWSPT